MMIMVVTINNRAKFQNSIIVDLSVLDLQMARSNAQMFVGLLKFLNIISVEIKVRKCLNFLLESEWKLDH